MKTLHLDLGEQWRGGQSQALLLMSGLRARGHEVELVVVADSPLHQRARKTEVSVHPVGRVGKRLRAASLLKSLLSHGTYEILHLHEAHGLTPSWLARAHRRVAVLASRRVAYPLVKNPLALVRYRSASRILAVSRFVAESIVASGIPPEKVEIIYDGIEVPAVPSHESRAGARRRWNILSDTLLVGCLGYLLPEKGQELLIRALPSIRERFPTARLMLAGTGPMQSKLERLSHELHVEPAVTFTGLIEDVNQFYSALDVFVFPSLAEPLGTSLLTAMAYGLPVVAVGRGAVPEVIENERSGLLVPDPEADRIAEATIRVLSDATLARRFGERARLTVEQRFSGERMVADTIRIYDQVLRNGQKP